MEPLSESTPSGRSCSGLLEVLREEDDLRSEIADLWGETKKPLATAL